LRSLECHPVISGCCTRYTHPDPLSFFNFFKVLAGGLTSAKLPPGSNF